MKLYEFQTKYLEGLPSRYIFSADTGTGKTFMALDHYKNHAYPLPLLIVAPASKVGTGDWERDLKLYFESVGLALPEYVIYSYEKFTRNPTVAQWRKTGVSGLWREWSSKYPSGEYAVIADECHRLANPQSGIGKAMFAVCKPAKFFVGLSATAVPNGWISMANYLKIFGYSKDITEFKKRYCNIQTYKGFPEIINYWREGELRSYWNGMSKPLSKDEALDLPPITNVDVNFKAGPKYIDVLKNRIFGDVFLDNPSALLHALRRSTMDNKLPWLNEFLDGVSDNVVIFYNYRDERDAILRMIKKSHPKRKVFLQDGEYHQVPAKEAWAGLDRTITLAQYQSGSTGIEMTYASTTVYFGPTYSYVNYEQSMGRTYRSGQTRPCTYYNLSAGATVENSVWKALREKKNFSVDQWYKDLSND